jgi:hypothetical protein
MHSGLFSTSNGTAAELAGTSSGAGAGNRAGGDRRKGWCPMIARIGRIWPRIASGAAILAVASAVVIIGARAARK